MNRLYSVVEQRFENLLHKVEKQEAEVFLKLRREALERFRIRGFPSPKDEEWRFSRLSWFTPEIFADPPGGPLLSSLPEPFGAKRWVFSQGSLSEAADPPGEIRAGVEVYPLSTLFQNPPPWFEPFFQTSRASLSPFGYLALAFIRDGYVVRIREGTRLAEPLEFLFLAEKGSPPSHWAIGNFLIVEPGASLTLLEMYGGEGSSFFHPLTQVFAGEDAEVNLIIIQQAPGTFHLGEACFYLGKNARFHGYSALLNGEYGRRDLRLFLEGEGGEGTLTGLILAGRREEMDHHTRVEHRAPQCKSDQYFKSVLMEQAHGIFDGSIYVHPGAQKTDALQTNKNILLSEQAYATANPHLEIYADDVRCTHGATVGQVNEEEEFYLRTRGIPASEARKLLTYAFVSDILERIPLDTLRFHLERTLFDRLVESHA